MTMDDEPQDPKRVITLDEIRERAKREQFSPDPAVNALRDYKIPALEAIARDVNDSRNEAAQKAIATAMRPYAKLGQKIVADAWSKTEAAESVRRTIANAAIVPTFDFGGLGTTPSTEDVAQETRESDAFQELTVGELAVSAVPEILTELRDANTKHDAAIERLQEVAETLVALAQSSAQDAKDSRNDARKSHRSAWVGIWVAIAVGLISTAATVAGIFTPSC